MELTKKAAYLKGLMDGLKIDDSTNEGRVLLAMRDLLGDICDAVNELDDDLDVVYDDLDQIYDELDAIDEDMDDLEDVVFDDDDDDEDDDEEDDEDEDEDEEDVQYELTCPNCGSVTVVDEDTLLNEQICCGNCGAEFEIEFEECGDTQLSKVK